MAFKPRAAAAVYANVAHDPGKEEGRFIESFGSMANQHGRDTGKMQQSLHHQRMVLAMNQIWDDA